MIICSLSVVVLTLMGSCRSKKVNKTPEVVDDNTTSAVVDEPINSRAGNSLTPMTELPDDSKAVKEMIQESNALKQSLSTRMNSLIYGPPEVMQRRATENEVMRHKIDSIDSVIRKERQK